MCIRDISRGVSVWFETSCCTARPLRRPSWRNQSMFRGTGRQGGTGQPGRAYVLAVLPATARIDIERLSEVLNGRASGSPPRTRWNESSATASAGRCRRSAGYTGSRPSSIRAWRGCRDRVRRQLPARRGADALPRLRDDREPDPGPLRPDDERPSVPHRTRRAGYGRRLLVGQVSNLPCYDDGRLKPALRGASSQLIPASGRSCSAERLPVAKPRRMVFSVTVRVRRNSRR